MGVLLAPYVCVTHACTVFRGQKKVSNPLEWELQMEGCIPGAAEAHNPIGKGLHLVGGYEHNTRIMRKNCIP